MTRWVVAIGAWAAAWVCPASARAADDAPAPDRLRLVDRFREARGRTGRRFEESRVGAYVNDHLDVALEYRLYQFLDEGTPQDSRRTRHEGRLEMEYEAELTDAVELFIETRVWVDDDDFATGTIDRIEDDAPKRHILDVPEAYVDLFFEDVDVRLGKQIVTWGKADVFNPTDQINPDDFSTLIDDEPIGVLAAKANYWWQAWGLEIVVVPTFTPSRFPPRGTRFDLVPAGGPIPILSPNERADTLDDVQYGLRTTTTYEGWDFSLSWYDGVNHFPSARLVPLPAPPFVAAEPVYNRRRSIGADFATTFDQLGLHGEAAWFRSDGQRQDEYYQFVLGLDYTWTNFFRDHDIFAIFEYAGEHVITQQRKGRATGALERAFANTVATNINYEVSEFLTYSFRAIYNFDGPDNFLVEPQVEYEVNDHLTVTAGFDIVHGGGQTLFGLLSENDQFYFRGRYTF